MNIQQQLYHVIEALALDVQEEILAMIHFLKTEIFTPAINFPL